MENEKILKAIAGAKETPLVLGSTKLECYVLEDGTRVFSGNGLQKALNFPKNAGGTALNNMLNTGELSRVITDEIQQKIENRKAFIRPGAGGALSKTYGYDATLLIDICNLLIESNNQGILTEKQKEYAKISQIIVSSVAKVGIIGLIDETTGYVTHKNRAKDELTKFLSQFMREEAARWVKTFDDNFFEMIYKMRGWNWNYTSKHPGVVGKWINDIVYERLAPMILSELRKKNPKNSNNIRLKKHHQFLSDEIGYPKLKSHLEALHAIAILSDYRWDKFMKNIDKAYPKQYQQLDLNLDFDDYQEDKNEEQDSIFDSNLKKGLDFNPNNN